MLNRPCPICRTPVAWESTPTRPFCSERCRTRDLGAWSAESYRVAAPEVAEGDEAWSDSLDSRDEGRLER